MPHDFDCRAFVAERDGHDIEPARPVLEPPSPEVIARSFDESTPLQAGDRFGCGSKRRPLSRLDLDENDGGAIGGNDVDFSTRRAVPARENCVPETLELAHGEIFADFPESDACA